VLVIETVGKRDGFHSHLAFLALAGGQIVLLRVLTTAHCTAVLLV
jgi:hypothetical protein